MLGVSATFSGPNVDPLNDAPTFSGSRFGPLNVGSVDQMLIH